MKHKIKELITKYQDAIAEEEATKHFSEIDDNFSRSKIQTLEEVLDDFNSIITNDDMYEENKSCPPK